MTWDEVIEKTAWSLLMAQRSAPDIPIGLITTVEQIVGLEDILGLIKFNMN